MSQSKQLQVFYHQRFVGTLALTAGCRAAFFYSDSWLDSGFSISFFHCL